jgi:hypothetical protein
METEPAVMEPTVDTPELKTTSLEYKTICSSLFSRNMDYLYLSKEHPQIGIFTTISPEVIFTGRPSNCDTLHVVDLKQDDLLGLLQTQVPLDIIPAEHYCIDLKEFSKVVRLTKESGDPRTVLHPVQLGSPVYGYDKESTKAGVVSISQQPAIYGLSKVEIGYLNDLFQSTTQWIDGSKNIVNIDLIQAGMNKVGLNYIQVDPVMLAAPEALPFNAPYLDGFDGVSIFEYMKKKPGVVSYDIVLARRERVVRHMFRYEDQDLVVRSIPMMYIFLRYKTNQNKG